MTTPDCPEERGKDSLSDGVKEGSSDTWVLEGLLVLSGLVMAAARQPQQGNYTYYTLFYSPVVKTPCFQYRGSGFDPWSGN